MASSFDVQNGLVSLVAQAVYPDGSSGQSAAGFGVKIYPGWAQQSQLDDDLIAGIAHISVFPTAMERNTTRYPAEWKTLTQNSATITLTQNGQQVTVDGTIPVQFYPQNVAIKYSNQVAVYPTQAGDTPTLIATGLAALIPGATSLGAVITLPGTDNIQALRVGSSGTSIREIRRQERVFGLHIWAPTPAAREVLTNIIDAATATTQFLTMPDEFSARLIYRNSFMSDERQKAVLYRNDMNFSVEFATTEIQTTYEVIAPVANVTQQPSGATAPVSEFTVNI